MHRPLGYPCVAEGGRVTSGVKASRTNQVPCIQCVSDPVWYLWVALGLLGYTLPLRDSICLASILVSL